MNINFYVNDYLLVWNILFRPSISDNIHDLKKRLYNNHKNQYNMIANDNIEILKDQRNFISNNDTMYTLVMNNNLYHNISKATEKHRNYLMNIWDSNRKTVNNLLNDIVRFPFEEKYNILVLHPLLDVVEYVTDVSKNTLSWGRRIDLQNEIRTLIDIVYCIVKSSFEKRYSNNLDIYNAIIELAIYNEMYTKLLGKSTYLFGNEKLKKIKRQLYPYWLMYLGADKEEMLNYMLRDKIVFDVDKYIVEKQLRKVDLIHFIDFCIKNVKHIIIEDVE